MLPDIMIFFRKNHILVLKSPIHGTLPHATSMDIKMDMFQLCMDTTYIKYMDRQRTAVYP